MIQTKPLHVRLDKIDGFVRIYDGTRYSTMFGSEKYDAICDGIRHFTSLKWGMTYIFFSLFCKNQIDSDDFLPIEKIMTLHIVITHIKLVLNKDKNHYYYKIFLEKCSYELAEK